MDPVIQPVAEPMPFKVPDIQAQSPSVIQPSEGLAQVSSATTSPPVVSNASTFFKPPVAQDSLNSMPNFNPINTALQNNQPQLGSSPLSNMGNKPKKSRKTLFVGIIAAGFVLLGSSAAGYFGVVVPNKPENVWAKTMSNMGAAYDEVVGYGLGIEAAKGTNTDGNFSYSYDEKTLTGDYVVKTYNSDLTSQINIKQDDFSAKFDLMSITPEGRKLPDLYVRVAELNSLETLTDPEVADTYKQYVGQWYVFDSEQYEGVILEEDVSSEYTTGDYKELTDVIGDVLKEYLFSTKDGKAVLKISEFVGKEDKYDQATHHYKVGVDTQALQAFEKAMVERVRATKIGSSLNSDAEVENYTGGITDQLNEDQSFDMWINSSTKLIQTIRATQENSDESYLDIGQLYVGGDNIPLFIKSVMKQNENTNNTDISLDLNRKEQTAVLGAKYVNSSSNDAFNLSSNFKVNNEPLNLTPPTDAKSILSLLYGEDFQDPGLTSETLGWNIGIDDANPQKVSELITNFENLVRQLRELPDLQR